MTDREIDNSLWRAYRLGARVAAVQLGKELPSNFDVAIASFARELAENESTLSDPTALAAKFPDMGPYFHHLSTLNLRNDRELAQRIYNGFLIATETEE